jgi:exodeoxyribonuclease-1
VGYNTIRFDDEITRFMFWRNLIDPYAREWQNGCGRWDLLDVVRMAYALRPDGIVWPTKEDGSPSFKLEHLTKANGLLHEPRTMRCRMCAPPSRWRGCCAQPPAVRFRLRPAQEGPRGCRDAPARHGAHGAALSACVGHVPAERGCLAVMWPLASHPPTRTRSSPGTCA